MPIHSLYTTSFNSLSLPSASARMPSAYSTAPKRNSLDVFFAEYQSAGKAVWSSKNYFDFSDWLSCFFMTYLHVFVLGGAKRHTMMLWSKVIFQCKGVWSLQKGWWVWKQSAKLWARQGPGVKYERWKEAGYVCGHLSLEEETVYLKRLVPAT